MRRTRRRKGRRRKPRRKRRRRRKRNNLKEETITCKLKISGNFRSHHPESYRINFLVGENDRTSIGRIFDRREKENS